MNRDARIYGQQFDGAVLKDLKEIDKKLEKETDPEEIMQLKMAKLYRGMELNAGPLTRNYRGYYPY